jgi:hypothetical protein
MGSCGPGKPKRTAQGPKNRADLESDEPIKTPSQDGIRNGLIIIYGATILNLPSAIIVRFSYVWAFCAAHCLFFLRCWNLCSPFWLLCFLSLHELYSFFGSILHIYWNTSSSKSPSNGEICDCHTLNLSEVSLLIDYLPSTIQSGGNSIQSCTSKLQYTFSIVRFVELVELFELFFLGPTLWLLFGTVHKVPSVVPGDQLLI